MKDFKINPWIITAIIFICGGVFLYFKIADYGFSFFVIFPIAAGFSLGNLTYNQQKKAQLISVGIGLIISLVFLAIVGIEGLVCVAMALPLIAILMVIGFWISSQYRKYINKNYNNNNKGPGQLNTVFIPLIILVISNWMENVFIPDNKLILVSNSIVLPYSCDEVFDGVKAMDKLDGEKPWLLQLGLPTPYKCELEDNRVGAKRICLFENGRIVAEVTEFKRGEILRMKVNEYNLTGNQWFKFKDAEYTFKGNGKETILTRTTSYESTLRPRFYWKALEIYGIEQEHKFVLQSLKKNLDEKYESSHRK